MIKERIEVLEQNLIVPLKYSWERKRAYPEMVVIQLSEEHQKELFEKEHDYLLDLRFKKFPNALTILPEVYYRESCKIFWPLRFIMYSSGANFLTDDLIPEGLTSRLELANIYLQKAQSFDFAKNYDHLTVLTFNSIASVLFHLDEKDASMVYVKLAVIMAKKLGINNEIGLSKISHFDYERENIRRIWWLIFSNYSLTPVSFGMDTMLDSDNQIFLPSENFYFEPGSPNDYYGIEIMSSKEWYTCTIKHQSLQGYRMILHRIQLKIHHYNQLELSGNRNDLSYIAGAISGSLEDWKITLSPIIDSYLIKLRFKVKVDIGQAWLAAYLGLVYNSCRINLVLANFMKNIIKGKRIEQQLYLVEALVAGKENSEIITLIIQTNPKIEHISSVSIFPIFICAFFLLCCRKIDSLRRPEIEVFYQLHLEALNLFSIAFQKVDRFYQILTSMEKLSILDTIIYFGTFKRRQMDEALEKQTPNHIEMVNKLSIN
ncbi:hypothetical protein HDV06_005194 [Boothiomyces sp. JEL0866]|nr:hypothetical protein HDV06_005194 [Boothiomyces sp. JEL0866]